MKTITIDCVSDLHGSYPTLPGGDLLIVAGDCTARDKVPEWVAFFEWIGAQKYTKKILIGGNHDRFLTQCPPGSEMNDDGTEMYDYLLDSGTEFEGIKIWGSPWTPTFGEWHFMKERGKEITQVWNLIPDDTQILITHGPPMDILDTVDYVNKGCLDLLMCVNRLPRLKLHVFGHIHEGYGILTKDKKIFVNASHMDRDYRPVNKPVRIILRQAEESSTDLRLESCCRLE